MVFSSFSIPVSGHTVETNCQNHSDKGALGMVENQTEKSQPSKSTCVTKTVSSADLFQNSKVIVIRHAGEEYRLSITSKDKLILTK